MEVWMTHADGRVMSGSHFTPLNQSAQLKAFYTKWKKDRGIINIRIYQEEDLANYMAFLATLAHVAKDEDYQKLFKSPPDQIVMTDAGFLQGFLGIMSFEPLKKEAIEILSRFAKAFEFTYTRFLDLQKAEAQAREAQIEAALERVRSQSMAMQHSSELNLILAKVFKELTNLELQMERAVIWIYYPENKSVRWWAANPEAESGTDSFLITNQDHPVYLEYWKYWEEKRTKHLYILEGENMVSWCDVLFNEMELGRLPKEVQEAMRAPEKVYLYNTFNDFGVLFLACIEPLSDDKFSVLERFGKVFDQSYTRFKDIKQAEAREKEAIKQSSLDRVRAEIASMRKTEDLQRITPLIWRELLTLGVPFFRCGLMIVDEKEEKIRFYLSTPDGKPLAALNLDYESNQISSNGVKHWRKQQPYIAHWNKEEFLAFAKTLLEQQQIENPITYQGGEEAPESLTLQFLPFPQGMLYVGSAADLTSAQIDLVQNLADAFSVAYARYEDFKQLEDAKSKIEYTLSELKSTQAQLIQSEKMASLGELTAGIAHEIQNPLNFVNNFSEVSEELVDEMNEELENGELEEAKAIGKDLKENLSKINLHGKRADAIVKGMLEHSRINKGEKAPTDLNALADEFVRLSYHGLRAKDKSFNADFKLELDPNLPKVNVVASDIGRVILNLVNNAFYAVHEKSKSGNKDTDYKPIVTVSTSQIPLEGGKGVHRSLRPRQRPRHSRLHQRKNLSAFLYYQTYGFGNRPGIILIL
uniref:sensor histidine kinase n=1 Tax=Algoriphagus halophilus TaxID=226505 RepID=UPI004037F68D